DVAVLDLAGLAGETLVGLQVPAGVARPPLVPDPGAGARVALLPGRRGGAGAPPRRRVAGDGGVEPPRPAGWVGGRGGARRGREASDHERGEGPDAGGRPGPGLPGRPRAIGGEPTAWFTSSPGESQGGSAVRSARCRLRKRQQISIPLVPADAQGSGPPPCPA